MKLCEHGGFSPRCPHGCHDEQDAARETAFDEILATWLEVLGVDVRPGVVRRMGYNDDGDGVLLEREGDEIRVVRRRDGVDTVALRLRVVDENEGDSLATAVGLLREALQQADPFPTVLALEIRAFLKQTTEGGDT